MSKSRMFSCVLHCKTRRVQRCKSQVSKNVYLVLFFIFFEKLHLCTSAGGKGEMLPVFVSKTWFAPLGSSYGIGPQTQQNPHLNERRKNDVNCLRVAAMMRRFGNPSAQSPQLGVVDGHRSLVENKRLPIGLCIGQNWASATVTGMEVTNKKLILARQHKLLKPQKHK